MENDAQAEHVADRSVLCFQVFQVDDFWGNVAWSTAPYKEVLFLISVSSQPKVSDYAVKIAIFSEENILWLEIPVHDVFGVHGFQSHANTFHDGFYFLH